MGIRFKLLRAPLTLALPVPARPVELIGGIHLPYTVRLGRRVRIWHHGGMVLHARSIGDDVHIRQNTTFGVAGRGRNRAIPIIGDRVDIGCGVCVLGDVTVGHDSLIGANAVVVTDIPPLLDGRRHPGPGHQGAPLPRRGHPMKLLIVIVSYRVTDLTIDCLRSLERRDRPRSRAPGSRSARTAPAAMPKIASAGPSTRTAGTRGWTSR